MEDLKQGTRVEFQLDGADLRGTGTIVGKATNGQPILGSCYIIEPDESIKSEVYDYSHFVAWSFQLKLI